MPACGSTSNGEMNILIVGASGNLGSHLARQLIKGPHQLRLLVHKTTLPLDVANAVNASQVQADLNTPSSLHEVCKNIDCIIYVAGVLFRPRPETFLYRTNTLYVQNLVNAALAAGVRKFLLISFPHVEGETTPRAPAKGRLDVRPSSVHSRTRLAAEAYLFRACDEKNMEPLVFRAGVIYGRGVKLTEAARNLMSKGLFAIWQKPTWVHLLALPDFVRIVELGIEKDNLSGIYNLCDDQPIMLQEFLDEIARHWGFRRPRRLPSFSFYLAAILCETFATIFRTGTPLTRDLVAMGMTSVVADTTRMKKEIVSELMFPTLREGLTII
jgi:nucleoside-diphosphate-sugar epimerase